MFGCKSVLPICINEKQAKPDIPDLYKQCNMEEAVSKLTVERLCVFKEVKENIGKTQSKQKCFTTKRMPFPLYLWYAFCVCIQWTIFTIRLVQAY